MPLFKTWRNTFILQFSRKLTFAKGSKHKEICWVNIYLLYLALSGFKADMDVWKMLASQGSLKDWALLSVKRTGVVVKWVRIKFTKAIGFMEHINRSPFGVKKSWLQSLIISPIKKSQSASSTVSQVFDWKTTVKGGLSCVAWQFLKHISSISQCV